MLSAWISITLSAVFTSLIPLVLCASLNAEAQLLTRLCHAETYASVEHGKTHPCSSIASSMQHGGHSMCQEFSR